MTDPAYEHYTVERETSEKPADPKRAFVQAAKWGWRGLPRRLVSFLRREGRGGVLLDPQVMLAVSDVVVIKDRSGTVVLSEAFDNPHKSEARLSEITSHLLALDVDRFRDAYRLEAPQ